MRILFSALLAFLRALVVPTATLALENAALRQQVAVFLRNGKRPRLKPGDPLCSRFAGRFSGRRLSWVVGAQAGPRGRGAGGAGRRARPSFAIVALAGADSFAAATGRYLGGRRRADRGRLRAVCDG